MTVKLLTGLHFEFLGLKGGCTCSSESIHVKLHPVVASSIPARSHTFVEIDHEIISTVILLPSAESFMKGCCQLQAKVCARYLVNCLGKKCG